MLFFGILLAPILLIIGLFKSHNNYTTSKQLRPFALYIAAWVIGCSFPFTTLLILTNEIHIDTFIAAPFYMVIFIVAILINSILVNIKLKNA